jgi:serine protease Do
MKWLPSRGSKSQNLEEQLPSGKHLLKSTPVIAGLTICLVGTGVLLSANASKLKEIFTPASSQKTLTAINDIAADISVKVLDQEFLGSGFILQQQDNQYLLITNQHVLRAGDSPYRVQTFDGKIYAAKVISSLAQKNYNYDLAVLQFTADVDYPVATIGSSFYLEVGEPIYAAGFPSIELESKILNEPPDTDTEAQAKKITGLTLKTGRVAIILNQALVEGYQIGYTNDVKKGMSGGPLLNSRGEVVGVNGKHAYPLWESPELYQDGSQLCPALEKLITRSSLAIPIEKSIELNPQLKAVKPASNVEVTRSSNLTSEDPKLVARMQAEAEITAQHCENYGENSSNNIFDEELGINRKK